MLGRGCHSCHCGVDVLQYVLWHGCESGSTLVYVYGGVVGCLTYASCGVSGAG